MTTLKPGGDLPEHLGHVYAEVTLWYSHNAKKQQWRSGLMTLQAKNPKSDEEALQIGRALAHTTIREMFRRPLAGMRRRIA